MRWPRRILFGDVDAMYASSAVIANPALDGQVMAVGSPPPRGIITSPSYAARRYGIRAAMPTAHALRLYPELILVPPDFALYRRMHELLRRTTERLFPVVAWTSIDEFYADTTELQSLYPDAASLGQLVKDAIVNDTGLRCTIAIATSKTVAKVGADGHKPDGLAVIEPGTEAAFLAPRPVKSLPGIGPKTAAELDRIGVKRIGDLLEPRFEPVLKTMWGARLAAVQALALGIDHDPVEPDRERKSIGHETTFDEDTADLAVLERIVRGFLGELTHELRVQGLAAGSFTLKLKDTAFKITTRQRRFPEPLNYDPPMWKAIRRGLSTFLTPRTRYRLIGLSLSDLVPATANLFDQRTGQAMAAMDAIIEKHGTGVMRLGGIPEEE